MAEVIVDNGAAVTLNFSLMLHEDGIKPRELFDKLIRLISTNTMILLIIGVVMLTISLTLVSCACYHKQKRRKYDTLGVDSAGFHRYKVVSISDDEEAAASRTRSSGSNSRRGNASTTRYTKIADFDNKKLLDDASEDDEDDKIFVR